MDVLGQLPGWTVQPGEGLGGDALSVFQDSKEARASGERRGVSGGTGTGPGCHGTEVFTCDGSPLEGGVALVVTRCALHVMPPCPADSLCQAQPLPHSL